MTTFDIVYILITIASVILGYSIFAVVRLQKEKDKRNKSLAPFYLEEDIIRASENFIEPEGRLNGKKINVIKFLFKEVFSKEKIENKYSIIFGDTGAGKTTLLLNTYVKYHKGAIENVNKQLFLYPLGYNFVIEECVAKIQNKRNAILLLDGLDEDIKAVENRKARLSQLLEVTSGFSHIVITSRTSFFDEADDEPFETGMFTYGTTMKKIKFNRIYLETLKEKSIDSYLNKYPTNLKYLVVSHFSNFKEIPNIAIVNYYLDSLTQNEYGNKESIAKQYESLINNWIEKVLFKIKPDLQSVTNRLMIESLLSRIATTMLETGNSIISGKKIKEIIVNKLGKEDSIFEQAVRAFLTRSQEGSFSFFSQSVYYYFLSGALKRKEVSAKAIEEKNLENYINPFK